MSFADLSPRNVSFKSQGLSCDASLFLPSNSGSGKSPVVVMGQGYGALWSFGTKGFIQSAVAAGFAVFAFNYRGFGKSEGSPRHLIDPAMQLDDWRAAIAAARAEEGVDAEQVYLWGSSFAGGHVISLAAELAGQPFLKAMLAQVPHCDSRTAFKHAGLAKALNAVKNALKDNMLSLFGKEHRMKIVGEPGDKTAVMDHAGWAKGYLTMAAGCTEWENSLPARSLLKAGSYNPIDSADKITCPTLIIYGDADKGVPPEDVKNTIAKIANCESWCYSGDHFDLYDGEPQQEETVRRQIAFLEKIARG